MDKKILEIIVLIVAVAVIVTLFLSFGVSKEDTKINMMNDYSLNENSSIEIKLTDLNKTPISNQIIYIKIINEEGNVDEYSVETNYNGDGKLELNKISPGNYTVNCTYEGNDKYNPSNLSMKITIVEDVPEEYSGQNTHAASSGSSSSSESDGYWETSIDAPFEYHTEYDSNGGFRQYDREGNLVGSSYEEDQDKIVGYPDRI